MIGAYEDGEPFEEPEAWLEWAEAEKRYLLDMVADETVEMSEVAEKFDSLVSGMNEVKDDLRFAAHLRRRGRCY